MRKNIDRCLFMCKNNAKESNGGLTMKKRRALIRLAAVLAALAIVFPSSSMQANAFFDNLFGSEQSNKNQGFNESVISSDDIIIGESIGLTARVRGLSESWCEYAFFVQKEGEAWKTIQGYTHRKTCSYTPDEAGSYRFCIKIRWLGIVNKKYFDVTVSMPLVNSSLVSTTEVVKEKPVKLYARAKGGRGETEYSFQMKRQEAEEWKNLSEFGGADYLQWSPRETGDYDIRISARDEKGRTSDKYFSLTVTEKPKRESAEFTITVEAPISSPYFWSCKTNDEDIIRCVGFTDSFGSDMLHPVILRTYRFRAVASGASKITLSYVPCGKEANIIEYDVVSDKNLILRTEKVNGSSTEKNYPELQQVKKSFSISVEKCSSEYEWKYEIGNNLCAEFDKTVIGSENTDTFCFNTLRKGKTTLMLTCSSRSNMYDKYLIFYQLEIDDKLNVSVINSDGIYIDGAEIPEVQAA